MSTSAALSSAALAAAAAPGARGGVRRLPAVGLVAAPGAAGFRGVVGFTLSTPTMASPPKTKGTMLAFAKATESDWGSFVSNDAEVDKHYAELSKKLEYFRSYGDEDDEFDKYYAALCKQTEEGMTGRFLILPLEIPFELSEEENALQNKLKEIAERCMDLQADAMRRLRPEQRRPLYLVFRTTHLALASVKVSAMERRANSGVSSLLIAHKLDVVRKMVSSACSAPLPLDTDKQEFSLLPPHVKEAIAGLGGVDSNSEVAFALIEYIYNTVKSDIDKMITASAIISKADVQDSDGSDAEVVELVRRLESMREWISPLIIIEELTTLTGREAVVLSGLMEVADRGYMLVKDVSARIKPVPGSPLFESLLGLGYEFLGLRRLFFYPLDMSITLASRLEDLRRIVASACDTPLRHLAHEEPPVRDDSLEQEIVEFWMQIVEMAKNFCRIVENDVNSMMATKY